MKFLFSLLLLLGILVGLISSFNWNSRTIKSHKLELLTSPLTNDLSHKESVIFVKNAAVALLSGILLLSAPVLTRGAVGEGDFPDGIWHF